MGMLNNITNLKYDKNSNMTIITALLLFYLIIGNNYTKNLYSGQLDDFIKSNRFVQHLIGFITLLVIIISFAQVRDIKLAVIYAFIGYIWFILTTKMDIQWSLSIFCLLLIGYFYENNMIEKEEEIKNDEILNEMEIKHIKHKNKKMKKVMFISLFALTLVGTGLYLYKKKMQYNNTFSGMKYLLG